MSVQLENTSVTIKVQLVAIKRVATPVCVGMDICLVTIIPCINVTVKREIIQGPKGV